jgi:PTS system fructose-specific IIC component
MIMRVNAMASKESTEQALRSYLTSVKEDVMTGVSHMIPFVTIGGIFLALAYASASVFGNVESVFEARGTLGWFLAQIGNAGLTIMVPHSSSVKLENHHTARCSPPPIV